MKPRQKVHSILLISEILLYLSLLSLSIIGCIKNTKKNEKVWFCSKILTLKQIIIDNMNNKYPIQEISLGNNLNYFNRDYSYLLMHSTENQCEINYKKCGILDSMKNIMCIPESDICPLNEIKTSLSSNYDNYERGRYFNYDLFFTNSSINNNIITNITISYEQPKYITTDNFIFDSETYNETKKKYYSSGDGGSDWGGSDYDYGGGDYGGDGGGGGDGGIGDGGGGWRNLEEDSTEIFYGDNGVTNYILEKFNEEINIDIYYQKIDNNLYYRNYIGFENNQQMEEFINADFRYNYKKTFPNTAAIVFGFISTIPFLILIIFAIKRLRYKDRPNSTSNAADVCCSKLFVIIIYMIFFLGYYIYFIVIYCLLHKKKINCSSLKKIKTEIFIEDFIKSFCSNNDFKNILVIIEISLLSLSFILFVFGWIVHIIVQRQINTLNELRKKKFETPTSMSSTKIVQ